MTGVRPCTGLPSVSLAGPPRVRKSSTDGVRSRRRVRGFTMVELLMTLAVSAVLLGISAPSFRTFIQNNRVAGTTSDFVTALNQARTEALKRGVRVYLCRTGAPYATNPACAANQPNGVGNASKDWSKGWVMYALPIDFDPTSGEVDYKAGAGHELIKRGNVTPADVTITSNTVGNRWLSFYADGTLQEGGAARYAICDDRNGEGDTGKLIEIPLIGRAAVSKTSDCTPS